MDRRPDTLNHDSPYLYIRPYAHEHRSLFFARDQEARLLSYEVDARRTVLLYARAGTGKTSLIRAAVMHQLREKQVCPIYVRATPAIDESIADAIKVECPTARAGPWVEAAVDIARATGLRPVFILDQFEEFFLNCRSFRERRPFIENVARLLEQDSMAGLLFSFRREFLGEFDDFRDLLPDIFHKDSLLHLKYFSREQAEAAIRLPLVGRGRVDDGLAQQILDELEDEQKEVSPAELQIVCDTLWRESESRRGLYFEDYERIGKRLGLVRRRFRDDLSEMSSAEISCWQALLPHLSSSLRTKAIVSVDAIYEMVRDTPRVDATLERAKEANLLDEILLREQRFVSFTTDYLAAPEQMEALRRAAHHAYVERTVQEVVRSSPEGSFFEDIVSLSAGFIKNAADSEAVLDQRSLRVLLSASLNLNLVATSFKLWNALAEDPWVFELLKRARADTNRAPRQATAIRLLQQSDSPLARAILAESSGARVAEDIGLGGRIGLLLDSLPESETAKVKDKEVRIAFGLRDSQAGPGLGVMGVRDRSLVKIYLAGIQRLLDSVPDGVLKMVGSTVRAYVLDVSRVVAGGGSFAMLTSHGQPVVLLSSRSNEPTVPNAHQRAHSEAVHETTHVCTWYIRPPLGLHAKKWNWFNEGTAVYMETEVGIGNPDFMRLLVDWVDKPEAPLTAPGSEYQAGMFVRYLGKTMERAAIWDAWLELSAEDPFAAIQAQLPKHGLKASVADIFQQYCEDSFFLCDLNLKAFFPEIRSRYRDRTVTESVRSLEARRVIHGSLGPLGCRYYRIYPDAFSESVQIRLESTGKDLRLGVHGLGRDLCRKNVAQVTGNRGLIRRTVLSDIDFVVITVTNCDYESEPDGTTDADYNLVIAPTSGNGV